MYRLLALILVVLVIWLQIKLWHGEGGWTEEQALKQQVDEQRSENARLKQRNAALEAEVQDLKSGQSAVEERARSELGMVKPGETFYRVVEPGDPKMNVRPEDVPEDAGSPASAASDSTASGSTASDAASTKSGSAPRDASPANRTASPPAATSKASKK